MSLPLLSGLSGPREGEREGGREEGREEGSGKGGRDGHLNNELSNLLPGLKCNQERGGREGGREGGRASYPLGQAILPPLEHAHIHLLLLVHAGQVASCLLPPELGALVPIPKTEDVPSELPEGGGRKGRREGGREGGDGEMRSVYQARSRRTRKGWNRKGRKHNIPSLPPSFPLYLSMSSPPIFSRRTISSKLMSPPSHRSFVCCGGRIEREREGGREVGWVR